MCGLASSPGDSTRNNKLVAYIAIRLQLVYICVIYVTVEGSIHAFYFRKAEDCIVKHQS